MKDKIDIKTMTPYLNSDGIVELWDGDDVHFINLYELINNLFEVYDTTIEDKTSIPDIVKGLRELADYAESKYSYEGQDRSVQ